MDPLISAFSLLINVFFSAYIFILLIRMLLQKTGVSWHNPFTQFVIKLTEPVIKPLRKFIPGYKGFDLSILALCLVLEFIQLWLLLSLKLGWMPNLFGIFLISVGELGLKISNILFYAVIIAAIMSWFPTLRYTSLAEIVYAFSEPLLRIVRRHLPLVSGFDFSPIIVVLALLLINTLILSPLIGFGSGFLSGF